VQGFNETNAKRQRELMLTNRYLIHAFGSAHRDKSLKPSVSRSDSVFPSDCLQVFAGFAKSLMILWLEAPKYQQVQRIWALNSH
jgi:hypothetical protein